MVNYKEKWLYVLGYKPPDIKKSVFENAFQLLRDVIMNETSKIVLLGDYDFNLLEENSIVPTCETYDEAKTIRHNNVPYMNAELRRLQY